MTATPVIACSTDAESILKQVYICERKLHLTEIRENLPVNLSPKEVSSPRRTRHSSTPTSSGRSTPTSEYIANNRSISSDNNKFHSTSEAKLKFLGVANGYHSFNKIEQKLNEQLISKVPFTQSNNILNVKPNILTKYATLPAQFKQSTPNHLGSATTLRQILGNNDFLNSRKNMSFQRGSVLRSTIGVVRSQAPPTIYEDDKQNGETFKRVGSLRIASPNSSKSYPEPIFRKGSLDEKRGEHIYGHILSPNKKVSFTPRPMSTPPVLQCSDYEGIYHVPHARNKSVGDEGYYIPVLLRNGNISPSPSCDSRGEPVSCFPARWQQRVEPAQHHDSLTESESGSEAGEIEGIMLGVRSYFRFQEPTNDNASNSRTASQKDEWGAENKGRAAATSDLGPASREVHEDEVRQRRARREEARRHTVGGDATIKQPRHAKAMDLEMSSKSRKKSKPPPTSSATLPRGRAEDNKEVILDHLRNRFPGYADTIGGHGRAISGSYTDVRKQSTLPKGYPPPSSTMFDDDPGIMSEAETSSTGFRRGGKQRSSLPVVRTPSKTLERPLGLVFLQYRSETKRALLPNEITSLDTVKALFVRSFPKQLTMEYLDCIRVKIYIHDSSKDMFYELEDLRDIRDRSVLRLFESDVNGGGPVPIWDQDQSYFSEPEFDSEFQHQHIHKTKGSSSKSSVPPSSSSSPYYMALSYPPAVAATATLPRVPPVLRPFSPAPVAAPPERGPKTVPAGSTSRSGQTPAAGPPRPTDRTYGPPTFMSPPDRRDALYSSPDRVHVESGYISSPERGRAYPPYPSTAYEDPYYSGQYGTVGTRSGSVTPVIDEESRTGPLYRLRVEHMERQLANLTGLVQKALTVSRPTPGPPRPQDSLELPAYAGRISTSEYHHHLQVPGSGGYRNADDTDKLSSSSSASLQDEPYSRPPDFKPPKLGKDKSVSFEKSVSFSDEPPGLNSPKQHSPQHTADTKPTKPAIKSSTLPRVSSQERERERHKPPPPPKPVALIPTQYDGRHLYRGDLHLTPELYNQLRTLQKKAKDLKQEVRNLRRLSQAQAHTVRETIRDTFMRIRAMLLAGDDHWLQGNNEQLHVSREEDLYKQEMIKLEKDLTELESTVEGLRSNVINRRTRVNMSDVENMALILSKSSKTVADLKARFPVLQDGMKTVLTSEMERVVREEKFLKEEPERLERALKRCKKLTGTLVTLKRLASVQEQRLPSAQSSVESRLSPTSQEPLGQSLQSSKLQQQLSAYPESSLVATPTTSDAPRIRSENPLDALLDELQTFARPPADGGGGGSPVVLRRLPSYPSNESSVVGSPVRHVDVATTPSGKPTTLPPKPNLLEKPEPPIRRVPPPPPPRTSSRSPLVSPTSPVSKMASTLPRSTALLRANSEPYDSGGGSLRRSSMGRSSLREGRPSALDTVFDPAMGGSGLLPRREHPLSSNSSSSESINSQEGLQMTQESGKKGPPTPPSRSRQEMLEQRHQELLRKQKQLQEQYARLQQLQRGAPSRLTPELKKTGSESNLVTRLGLNLSAAPNTGSLTHLAPTSIAPPPTAAPRTSLGGAKVYETDIL